MANTVLSMFRARSESVSPPAQEQPPVGPDRVDGTSPAAVDLLGEPLPDFGEHVLAELDQVERVDRDCRAREPHSQGLAECR
ncbi:hypothetical protein GCM10017710_43310 [Arthrobacter ramosus]